MFETIQAVTAAVPGDLEPALGLFTWLPRESAVTAGVLAAVGAIVASWLRSRLGMSASARRRTPRAPGGIATRPA